MRIDLDSVAHHEQMLTTYALEQLNSVAGITLYGETCAAKTDDRVGVIPCNLRSLPHGLVAAILGYEGGIGVRSGCFCAQSYVAMLLGREPPDLADWQGENPRLTRSTRPGMVRVSLGLHNTREDVDVLVTMLKRIVAGDYRGRYAPVPETGEYRPVGYEDPMPGYFSLMARPSASGAVARRQGL